MLRADTQNAPWFDTATSPIEPLLDRLCVITKNLAGCLRDEVIDVPAHMVPSFIGVFQIRTDCHVMYFAPVWKGVCERLLQLVVVASTIIDCLLAARIYHDVGAFSLAALAP